MAERTTLQPGLDGAASNGDAGGEGGESVQRNRPEARGRTHWSGLLAGGGPGLNVVVPQNPTVRRQRRADGYRSRNWVFTYNNYPPPPECWERLGSLEPSYFSAQPELSPTTGTRHLQGCIVFANARKFSSMRSKLPWYVEPMEGTLEQAIAYCSKPESFDADAGFAFYESGTRPLSAGEPGGRSDLKAVASLVQSGAGVKRVAEEHPDSYILYSRGIEKLIGLYQASRNWITEVQWLYGPTGSGKTRHCATEAPDAYWKSAGHHWWDGYESQVDVIIDDYRADFCKFSELLRLLDRYPYQIQVKGGTRQLVAKRIFITCPKHPVDVWENRSEEDIAQLTRRITKITHFGVLGDPN